MTQLSKPTILIEEPYLCCNGWVQPGEIVDAKIERQEGTMRPKGWQQRVYMGYNDHGHAVIMREYDSKVTTLLRNRLKKRND